MQPARDMRAAIFPDCLGKGTETLRPANALRRGPVSQAAHGHAIGLPFTRLGFVTYFRLHDFEERIIRSAIRHHGKDSLFIARPPESNAACIR